MKNVVICIGLPGSGKSTWAKEQQLIKNNTLIVNRDSIRTMLGGKWTAKYEDIVKLSEMEILKVILQSDFDGQIIIDDTNLKPKTLNALIKLCNNNGIKDIQLKSFLDVPIDICIQRDSLRNISVGRSTIENMALNIPELKKILHL